MTAQAPRVSVITSTYHWPSALRLAITTVLEQSYQDFEYLIVGDHCSDETEQVVEGFSDPRIRWINLEEHQGNQSNVNRIALSQCRGELIAYLNHDDLWLPTHLENLVVLFDASADLNIANSLCLVISPPPHLHRSILGLPYQYSVPSRFARIKRWARRIQCRLGLGKGVPTVDPASQAVEYGCCAMTSTVMHRASAGLAAGGWQDWRHTHEIPTLDFFRRIRALEGDFAVLGKLTTIKFHSGDRKQSYRLRHAEEQQQVLTQLSSNPQWLADQLAVAGICNSLNLKPPQLPQPQRPKDAPHGWQIEQWRRMRGLPPLIDLGISEPDESLMQLPPPSPLLRRNGSSSAFWRPGPQRPGPQG
ncbi:MAG: glycosyltransferase family 2 protein [Synechococcaceae cyanobacterium]|nr:glycosyltransferase family 2 protein [Synechococcaceae cyanobacterium]